MTLVPFQDSKEILCRQFNYRLCPEFKFNLTKSLFTKADKTIIFLTK